MPERVPLGTIIRCWGRIGIIGFGGPPAHIALLRQLCVTDRKWLTGDQFEDGIAATSLLPGPASTQMSIWCAWRVGGPAGALVGGAAFITPGLIIILCLSALFLTGRPPRWVLGAAAGAGAAVPAVAVGAARFLLPASWERAGSPTTDAPPTAPQPADTTQQPAPSQPADTTQQPAPPQPAPPQPGDAQPSAAAQPPAASGALSWPRARWVAYLGAGAVTAAVGGWVVVVLLACGVVEVLVRRRPPDRGHRPPGGLPLVPLASHAAPGLLAAASAALAVGGLAALAWVAFKVGALSFGGGFVIIPLMQHDAVNHYHWMSGGQFLDAVALGQVTPGPVVLTVAVIGYAAAGIKGGLLAVATAFAPSFAYILIGGGRFDRVRRNPMPRAFLAGAGPAAIGAIAGAAIPLASPIREAWQVGILVAAALWVVVARRSVPWCLLAAGLAGVGAALVGAGVPR